MVVVQAAIARQTLVVAVVRGYPALAAVQRLQQPEQQAIITALLARRLLRLLRRHLFKAAERAVGAVQMALPAQRAALRLLVLLGAVAVAAKPARLLLCIKMQPQAVRHATLQAAQAERTLAQ